jgi:hypothetical protein
MAMLCDKLEGMPEAIVGLFWTAVLAYAVIGAIFAIPFVLFWSGWLDPGAKAGSLGFRLIILPGAIAFWPLMALKTLRALHQGTVPPDPERPVTPALQRLIHGLAIGSLAVVLPVVCVLALVGRPRQQLSTAGQLQPAPFPNVISRRNLMPEGLPVSATLRTDGTRDQVELQVSRSINEPVVALFWSRKAEPGGVPIDAIFLGSVWGPTGLLFDLPPEKHRAPGVLTFIALAGEQRVLATLPLDAP